MLLLNRLLAGVVAGLAVALAATAAPTAPTGSDLLERAYVFDAGKEGRRDIAAAVRFYEDAATAGNAHAHLRLGHLFEVGDGVPQDYAIARRHYQAAVDLGLHAARVPLAICYLEGWGGPVDRDAFVAEIRTAAEAGDVEAQKILASAYGAGIGVPRNIELCQEWFKRAAEADDANAQLTVGQHAEARRFITRDNIEIARTWYQLSAEQEYLAAFRAMARSCIEAPDGQQDWASFRQWLEFALEAGDSEAPYTLAAAELLRRDLRSRDIAQAQLWLEIAAERGNSRALEVLDLIETGRALEDAMRHVVSEPQEDRYVQRSRRMAGTGPTRPPVALKAVTPVYPLAMRAAGITGEATMSFIVDSTGRVRDIKAVAASHPVFAERAAAALREWRFEPGRKEGRIVSTRVQLTFPFNINEEILEDVDRLLRWTIGKAQERGQDFVDATRDLRLAKPRSAIAFPEQGRAQDNERRYAIVLLALDAAGNAVGGRVLEADPAALGDEWLQIALKTKFEARIADGKPSPSNVVLPFFSEMMKPPFETR